MRRMLDVLRLGAAAGCVAFGVVAATALRPADARADARNNILVIGQASEPFTLDPAMGVSGFDYPNLYPIFDRLIDFDADLNLRPGLATKWEFTGADKLTLELTLRQGVTFHDGTPLTAEAVRFSLLHFKETGRIHDLDAVAAVDVVAPDRVALRLSRPYSVMPAVLSDRAGMIVSPTAVQKGAREFERRPVGTGPFMLRTWNAGTSVDLVRYPGYWDADRIKLAGIQFRIILNPTSLVSALLSGQVDHAWGIDPKDIPALRADPKLRVAVEPSTAFFEIALNDGLAPVDNTLVRQALNMSIDRQALADAILGPGMSAGPALMLAPPNSFAHTKELDGSVTYDPAKARALLAQAGHPNGITLRICATPLVGYGTDITDIEREQMRPAGITLDVTVQQGSACLQAFNLRKQFPAWQGAFSGRPDPYLTYAQNFGSAGQYNLSHTAAPGVDELLDKILTTYDRADQKPLYDQLNRLYIESAPAILLFYRPNVAVYGKGVAGEQPNAQGKPNVVTMYFAR